MSTLAARTVRAGIIATVVALSACTPEGDAPEPEPTSSTTEASTTTTTVPTTTTTASLPPQVLRHRLDDGRLVTYDVTLGLTMDTTSSGSDPMANEIVASITGTLEHLFIAETADGAVEIAQRIDGEGSVTVESGGTTVTQEIGPQDVAGFGAGAPLLVTRDGLPTSGRTGAATYFEAPTRVLDVLQTVGPIFGEAAVDVEDTWTVRVADPMIGPISVSTEIVGEEDSADGRTFAFEVTASATDLPIETSYAEAVQGGWVSGDVADAVSVEEVGLASAELTFREVRLEGSGSFDPVEGRLVRYSTTTTLGYEMDIGSGDEMTTLEYGIEMTMDLRLRDVAPAGDDDVARVLSAYSGDPFQAADQALPTPAGYVRGEFERTRLATLFDKLADTRSDLVVAGSFARFIGADDVAVDVGAITNGGALRGDPEIMSGLGTFWSGEAPTPTTAGSRPAVVVSVDGESWLIWASDTHTYVAIGEPDTARAVIAALADTVDPYLWQPGDCLDFSPFDGERPYSPFGTFGLVHCRSDHQYEVLHSETLPEGPDAPFPDDLPDRVADTCAGAFVAATGVTPIQSRLGYVRYSPDQAEWDRGARYIACVLYLPEDGAPSSIRGRLDPDHPDLVRAYASGMCLRDMDPVSCSEPHSHEIVAVRTYDAPPSAPRPDDPQALFDELDERCAADEAEYGLTEGPVPTAVGSFSDIHFAWNEGTRDYYCVAFAPDEMGVAVEVVGSMTGEWSLAPEGESA